MHETLDRLNRYPFPAIRRGVLDTLQVNLGYRCNQSCLHCHVNAGPNRREAMSSGTIDGVLQAQAELGVHTVDLTGGAPELHPQFRSLVETLRSRDVSVIDRCNLTVLYEPGQEDTAGFLAQNSVRLVASLPCYLEENVDAQRGDGVFAKSIEALRMLNALGYGDATSGLVIDLVYNPQGPALPPDQQSLEKDYKRHLGEKYGIQFNALLTLANMPIKRFGSTLVSRDEFDSYMDLLKSSHRDENLDAVMCRSLVSIDWQGYVYDCDFNQMLDMPCLADDGEPLHVTGLSRTLAEGSRIRVSGHCFGCTAGQGSGCGGALTAE